MFLNINNDLHKSIYTQSVVHAGQTQRFRECEWADECVSLAACELGCNVANWFGGNKTGKQYCIDQCKINLGLELKGWQG